MRHLPILKEIKIIPDSAETIQESFEEGFHPETPIYINLLPFERGKHPFGSKQIVQILENQIIDMEYYFYYPLYIISQELENHTLFSVVRELDQIPKHFQKSINNVKGRELLLLKKLSIVKNRLKTTQLNSRIELVKYQSDNLKTVKDLSIELSFYKKILEVVRKYQREIV